MGSHGQSQRRSETQASGALDGRPSVARSGTAISSPQASIA